MRGRLECSTARAAWSTSSATARASDAMMGPSISLATDAGADEVIVRFASYDQPRQLELFAERVLPSFR